MTDTEYQELQKQFKNKIVLYPTNKEEAYNRGVRSCMSILHNFYTNRESDVSSNTMNTVKSTWTIDTRILR